MDNLTTRFATTSIQNDDNVNEEVVVTERSSWAEVVSSHGNEKVATHEKIRVCRRPNDPPRQNYECQQNYDDHNNSENSEGWNTVGRRRQHGKGHPQVSDQRLQGFKRPPEEQEYADETPDDVELEPTEDELSNLSKACDKIWNLDHNRLVPGQDYEIDRGEGKRAYQGGDMAENTLFSWVKEDVFRKPTFARFVSLLDNYNPLQTSHEKVTTEEKREEIAFIEEISRTAPIRYLHKYLVSKGCVSDNYGAFKKNLKELWFDFFSRHGTRDSSCAFEHVFVGEVKSRGEEQVCGFHNWVQFYLEEASGRIDYMGYIFPRRRRNVADSDTQLLTVQFSWNGILKSASSTFVGVSPEFELALYTLCYYSGKENNSVELGPYDVNIKCYTQEQQGRTIIGSIFPIAEN